MYSTNNSVADYDALALSPTSDSPPEFDQTRFPVTDSDILDAAKEIAESLRRVSFSFLIYSLCLIFFYI